MPSLRRLALGWSRKGSTDALASLQAVSGQYIHDGARAAHRLLVHLCGHAATAALYTTGTLNTPGCSLLRATQALLGRYVILVRLVPRLFMDAHTALCAIHPVTPLYASLLRNSAILHPTTPRRDELHAPPPSWPLITRCLRMRVSRYDARRLVYRAQSARFPPRTCRQRVGSRPGDNLKSCHQ